MPKIIKPKVGDLIQLPIDDKFAIGLVIRVDSDNTPLGYFYHKLYDFEININNLNLDFFNPLLIKKFGFQGFMDGTWKILGSKPNFKREDFPVPVFYTHTLPFKPQLVYFDDEMNEVKRVTLEESDQEKSINYPQTGLAGSGFIEKRLKRLILEKENLEDLP
jgi:hypothetical protein